jgi:twitching motility protein PilT
MPRCDTNGMVAAYEFMLVTPAIANLIREGKPVTYIDSAIQTGRKFGMRLLDDHLWQLYQEGKISAEDMVDKAREPSQLVDKVHRAGGTINRAELDDPEALGQAG